MKLRRSLLIFAAFMGMTLAVQARADEGKPLTKRIPPVSVSDGRTFQMLDFTQLDPRRQSEVLHAYQTVKDSDRRAAECTSLIGPTWWSVNCISGNCHCYIYGSIDANWPASEIGPSTSCGCN